MKTKILVTSLALSVLANLVLAACWAYAIEQRRITEKSRLLELTQRLFWERFGQRTHRVIKLACECDLSEITAKEFQEYIKDARNNEGEALLMDYRDMIRVQIEFGVEPTFDAIRDNLKLDE